MPEQDAKFGDVYWVTKEATQNPAKVCPLPKHVYCLGF